jgi:hypothetical protein
MFTPVLDLEVLQKATILRFTDVTGVDTGTDTKWDGLGSTSSAAVSLAQLTVTDPNGSSETIDCTARINAAWPIEADEDIVFADIEGEWPDGFYTVVYNVWMTPFIITSISDYSGTVSGTILITAAGHNVQSGMKVTIGGGSIYDGDYDAIYVDANHFYISSTFIGDSAALCAAYFSNSYSPFVFANVEMAIDRMLAVFCNMDEGVDGDEYLREILLLKGLLMALRSAITTTTTARINNIYGRITRILDFNGIELTYT